MALTTANASVYIGRLQASIERWPRCIGRVPRDLRRQRADNGGLQPHICLLSRHILGVQARIGQLQAVIERPARDIRGLRRPIDRLQAHTRPL